ncbi:putative isomerase [Vibrio zhanjiangensis]|uniref:Isomerase n=1 Tax=Vibrio zhanjiangensis TaxID=1046128 RepID=A0ABQ6EWA7_9VIBR|nr:PhzF family phenazine biosynthesis protein [Vibrio zhanjiangensis]GLT16991.1 putative isomerase [Vibrio zhanjiangensis]
MNLYFKNRSGWCFIQLIICDVFVSNSSAGNPSGVVELEYWLCDDDLLQLARRINQPVTAFVVSLSGDFHIRWFALAGEINLCGHGSLAAGAVMLDRYFMTHITFHSQYGNVTISKEGNLYSLVLPSWSGNFPAKNESGLRLPCEFIDIFSTRDLVVVLPSVEAVISYTPNYEEISKMNHHHALMVTGQDGNSGYVLRYFAPKIGIDEDLATGSAQCSLAPYWFNKLAKERLAVNQLSHTGGYFEVERLSDQQIKLLAQVTFR